jgi:(R,R)-butanediol dehydrogenase/meso-butanediol dehydrogenase/diacetyl reductase
VLGGGPIGAACLLAARAAGATRIVVVEPLARRRALATSLGASNVCDPATDPVHRQIKAITDGLGADVVFECSGVPDALEAALKSTRRRGTVVVPALGKDSYVVDGRQLVLHERRILGSLGYNYDLPRVLALIAAGRLEPAPLITGVHDLADAVGVIEALAEAPDSQVKVLIRPGGAA